VPRSFRTGLRVLGLAAIVGVALTVRADTSPPSLEKLEKERQRRMELMRMFGNPNWQLPPVTPDDVDARRRMFVRAEVPVVRVAGDGAAVPSDVVASVPPGTPITYETKLPPPGSSSTKLPR
jgi:hypothetical protein